MKRCTPLLVFAALLLAMVTIVYGFQTKTRPWHRHGKSTHDLYNTNNDGDGDKPRNFLEDLKGMFQNLDDVVDDFVYKRMGAGEQWYGKRKYNPSGRVDGDYNGMGRSDYFRIEIARVQKEEMELRKKRRLEEEEARKLQK
jgi:hypothetical protein